MIKLFYNLFNHDKIDDMQRTLDIYKERNQQLENELREYKGYKLKYEVTKLYVEDDEALLELFEAAELHKQYLSVKQNDADARMEASRQQQLAMRNINNVQGIGNLAALGCMGNQLGRYY